MLYFAPRRFEGLEEDKIAGFSNLLLRCKDKEIAGHSNIYWLIVTAAKGLAEDKITWHSNSKMPRLIGPTVWEAEEITGFSNTITGRLIWEMGLEEDEITWFSNDLVPFICYTLDLEGCEIAGYSNIGKSTTHRQANLFLSRSPS